MRRSKVHLYLFCLVVVVLVWVSAGSVAETKDERFKESVRQAELIFRGPVLNVQYRNSEIVPALDPETHEPIVDPCTGEPVWIDGSDLPHTFVTYQIDHIYKGKVPIGSPIPGRVTLRFEGGLSVPVDPNNSRILRVSFSPLFDIGDRDVLLVKGNTVVLCPLVGGTDGRYRLITDPNDLIPKVYSEYGQRIVFRPVDDPNIPGSARRGPYQELTTVTEFNVGPYGFRRVRSEFQPPANNPAYSTHGQFTESEFHAFLASYVEAVHTPQELQSVPPIHSADITHPFQAHPLTPASGPPTPDEPPVEMERPWLDGIPTDELAAILEQEDEEARLLELTGGNPVLPKSDCEIERLRFGGAPSDISGPDGKPDCRTDMFDFARFSQLWLDCYGPGCGE